MKFSGFKTRRQLAHGFCTAVLAALLLPWSTSHAQAWPSKPIRVVVPFGPGSALDIVTRTVTEPLRAELGQPFIVDNRAGANGFIAAEAVARAAPDGYTLLSSTNTLHSTNQFLFKKLPYDPVKDFIPVGGMHKGYYVLLVPSSLPVNNVAELAAWLKAHPQKANYGWGATASQIGGAAFLKEVNATATGVPYKSSPQAVTDLIAGQLSFMVLDVTSGLQHVKNGMVKALAVTAPSRLPQLPDVPTTAEAGIPSVDTSAWTGLFVPAGTPAALVQRLSTALQKVLHQPIIAERLDACCSAKVFYSTPAEFDAFLQAERIAWSQKIKAAGIEPE
jgi:tripartite-type tricarboxylate transporter receptor subunit TctC